MTDTTFEAWHLARPNPPRLSRRVLAYALKAALGATALIATAFGVTFALQCLPKAPAPAPAAPPPIWREIVKPVHIYSLQAPGFSEAAMTYAARRHVAGGGREDLLTLGQLDGAKTGLRLRIFRRAAEAPKGDLLFAALAHEAAQAGLSIDRSGLPALVPTRFGRFEIEDVSLSQGDAAAMPCSGFRLNLEQPALSILGLACGPRKAPLSQANVGCLIERLDVAAARDDRELIDFFAASELRRNAACSGMRLGPDGLHAPWLDDPTPATPAAVASDKSATSRKRLRRR